MSNVELTYKEIMALDPNKVIRDPRVKNRFIQIYDTLWGEGTGMPAYERESNYFNALMRDGKDMQTVTSFSVFTSFIDLAVCGLSLEPGVRALCYLMKRKYNTGIGSDGKKTYETHLVLTISGYGELVLRERAGQIRHADNPVLVYDEDEFSFSDINGSKQVNYTCHIPHTSGNIVAAYMRITRTDGSIDYAVMLQEDWERLAQFSAKQNKRWDDTRHIYIETPNELYSSNEGKIDPGFLAAKCIKHAFKSYPKVRIGKAELESQQVEEVEQDIEQFYKVQEQPVEEPAPFTPQPDLSAGVMVNDPSDDTF